MTNPATAFADLGDLEAQLAIVARHHQDLVARVASLHQQADDADAEATALARQIREHLAGDADSDTVSRLRAQRRDAVDAVADLRAAAEMLSLSATREELDARRIAAEVQAAAGRRLKHLAEHRMGEYLARVLDLSDSRNPRMQEAWFGEHRYEIYVRFSLPNGGVLRTGGSETVTDIWVNGKGQDNTWAMTGHTARIVDPEEGIVRLEKTEGEWPDGARVGYVINVVALENVEGYLYERAVDGRGTGVLAMEEGLGIPVQPHLPVPYPTSIVTVQKERER